MTPTKVLVTGGAGCFGSTICSALEDAGHTPIILDSLVNGYEQFARGRPLYKGDIADDGIVGKLLEDHADIEFLIHCAALTIVPDSVERPYEYYWNNIVGSLRLFRMLAERGCRNVIFSSSASVYDAVLGFMVTEDSLTLPQSTYTRSKLMTEVMLKDMAAVHGLKAVALRYFNLIGADPLLRSGQAQPSTTQIVNVLVDVARGVRPTFQITGTDWPTRDGTGIRDYVHVWDLTQAHVKALERMDFIISEGGGFTVINLGTGSGVTVREIAAAFKRVHGSALPKRGRPRETRRRGGGLRQLGKGGRAFGLARQADPGRRHRRSGGRRLSPPWCSRRCGSRTAGGVGRR